MPFLGRQDEVTGSGLDCLPNGRLPAEQEKAVTAKRAPVGLKKPAESHLHGISGACASEVDGSAIRAMGGEEPYRGTDHKSTSAFTALFAAGPARFGKAVAYAGRASVRRAITARLARPPC